MNGIFCDKKVIQSIDTVNHKLSLKEEKVKGKIEISHVPDDAILIKLDVDLKNYKEKSIYLRRGKEFIHKGCDYCLIVPSQNLILLMELKSDHPKPREYVDQFSASEIFLNYVVELSSYLNKSLKDFTFKRILFATKYNNKLTSGNLMAIPNLEDRLGKNIQILTAGFPPGISYKKLI